MTTRFRPEALLPWLVVAIASVPAIGWAFPEGVVDWQYELGGLADPFLGRPAPGFTVVIAIVLTVVATIAVRAVRKLARHMGWRRETAADPPHQTRIRARWWLPVAGGWAAYALGAATVLAAGGPRTFEGTMRFAFGPPIGAAVEVAATCLTPVGKPELLAEVRPVPAGLYRLGLLNAATGDQDPRHPWSGARVELVGSRAASAGYPLPNAPARSNPQLVVTMDDGTTRSEPPIAFLAVYDYEIARVDGPGMAGDAEIIGTRWRDPHDPGSGPARTSWIDLEIPNDPWPQTLNVTVSWTCLPPVT